jgi:hypothetical protein
MEEVEPRHGDPIVPLDWRKLEAARRALSPNLMVSAGTAMPWELAEPGTLLGPLEYHPLVPVEPVVASQRLGWAGLEAARFSDLADAEFYRPALTHHSLILFTRPPDELDLRYEDVERHRPPPPPGPSRSCRPGPRPDGAGAGPRARSTSTWSRSWSGGSPRRSSASTRRGGCCPRSTPWTSRTCGPRWRW